MITKTKTLEHTIVMLEIAALCLVDSLDSSFSEEEWYAEVTRICGNTYPITPEDFQTAIPCLRMISKGVTGYGFNDFIEGYP